MSVLFYQILLCISFASCLCASQDESLAHVYKKNISSIISLNNPRCNPVRIDKIPDCLKLKYGCDSKKKKRKKTTEVLLFSDDVDIQNLINNDNNKLVIKNENESDELWNNCISVASCMKGNEKVSNFNGCHMPRARAFTV